MKDRRDIIDINDFSGGLVTNIPITSMETKFTPDCINVYAEGVILRKRTGHIKLNTNTAGAGSNCNGIFNWLKSATEQLLVSVFGNKLYKMDLSGTVWDGTFDVISAHATSGTPLTHGITHFANFSGTMLIVNENRTHPQKMLATDTSHFDIESGGSGTAPKGKYIQVWKEHVWILNIGAGGELEENFNSISAWNDDDVGGGASTQATTDGLETLKMVGLSGASASHAIRTQDIGDIKDDYIVEIKTNFDFLESVGATSTSTGYGLMHFDNGTTRLETRWSDDGLEIYDGTNWNEIGVSQVAEDVWNTWKLIVTGGTAATATIDVIKDGTYIGIGLDMSSAAASTASDGQIKFTAQAGTGTGATYYIDFVNINASNPQVEYYTDGDFSAWDDSSTPTAPNLITQPIQPYAHYRCNDNAANTTVTDDGSGANNGVANVNTSNYSVAGKINQAFELNGSSEFIAVDALEVDIDSDTTGSISVWVEPDDVSVNNTVFSLGDTDSDSFFFIQFDTNGKLNVGIFKTGSYQWRHRSVAGSSANVNIHVMVIQNGTSPKIYVNNVDVTNLITSVDITVWFSDIEAAVDNGRIGSINWTGGGNVSFFDGEIDDFRYYQNKVLTETDRLAIFKDGDGTEGSAITVQEGTTFKIGTYSYEFTNVTGEDVTALTQTVASSTALAGITSVIGMWVYGTNNASYKFRLDDGTTNHDTATLTASGTWQYQTYTFTPNSSTTSLKVKFLSTTAATFFIDQVSVEKQQEGTISDNADRIQRSAIGLFDDWDGTDSGTNNIATAKDVGLTGSFIINDRMYVTKKHSIHRFTYTASTPLVDIKQIRSSIGTSSPRSAKNVVIPGRGEVVIFLGTDRRLYVFDGFDSTSVSTNIEFNNGITSVYMQNINTQVLDKVFAVVHDDNPWYEIFVPIGNSTTPDFSIVYDYIAKSFWPMGNRNFISGAQSDNGSGQIVVYLGDNSAGFVHTSSSGNSDNGSSINGNWVSAKLGDPTLLSRYDEINLITDSVAVTPTLQWREDFTSTYVSNTLSASSNLHNYNPRLNDNYIQFRINDDSVNPAFKVWNLRVLAKGLGHGK